MRGGCISTACLHRRGGCLEDISVRDLDVSGTEAGFLRLKLPNGGLPGEDPVPRTTQRPQGELSASKGAAQAAPF